MRLLADCEGEKFPVSVGSGNKDLAWLAQVIAHIYGRNKHPTHNYTPIFLKNAAGDSPHPRSRINQVFTQNDEEVFVQIRKAGVEIDEEQQEWYDKAFGKLRYRMKCKFYYAFEKRPFFDKYPDAKIINFSVFIKFEKFPGSQIEFFPKDIQGSEELPMESRFDAKEFTDYYLEKDFPFGKIMPELKVTYTLKGTEDEVVKKSLGSKEQGFTYEMTPNIMSDQEMIELEVNEIKKQMEQIEFKPDKEPEREEPLGQCPYTVDTLWKIFDWTWLSKDTPNESIMNYLSNELDRLYEIFFHYSQFHVQDLSKRDQIAITWQDLFLILKFYEIMPSGSMLRNFLISYNQESNAFSTVEDTISVENPLQFPEFIFILLRAISYVKNNYKEDIDYNEEKKSRDEDKSTAGAGVFEQKLNQMISIHANDEDLTDFQRHMLFSAPLIELLRLKSPILAQTFAEKLKNTLQPSENKFYLLKGEICKIIDDIGFLGENVDQIVDTCFNEITPGEKYHEFEGLYYYEYLQALQWLSLVFIQKKEENIDPNEEDIEVNDETLIEKLGFFLERLEQTGEEEIEEEPEEGYA